MIHSNSEGPKYSFDELERLQVEIERGGGAILDDPCSGEEVVFKPAQGGRKTHTTTCHCGNQSMAIALYEPADTERAAEKIRQRGGGFARVCMYCDVMGRWPRYAHAVDKDEYDGGDGL